MQNRRAPQLKKYSIFEIVSENPAKFPKLNNRLGPVGFYPAEPQPVEQEEPDILAKGWSIPAQDFEDKSAYHIRNNIDGLRNANRSVLKAELLDGIFEIEWKKLSKPVSEYRDAKRTAYPKLILTR
jgi:hypothetical protein